MATSRLVAPTSDAAQAPRNYASAALEASRVVKPSNGNLYWLTVDITSASGWLMLFDAVTVPADGTVTPLYAVPVTFDSANSFGFASLEIQSLPMHFKNGICAVFSTTGPFTKTASATAAFFVGFM